MGDDVAFQFDPKHWQTIKDLFAEMRASGQDVTSQEFWAEAEKRGVDKRTIQIFHGVLKQHGGYQPVKPPAAGRGSPFQPKSYQARTPAKPPSPMTVGGSPSATQSPIASQPSSSMPSLSAPTVNQPRPSVATPKTAPSPIRFGMPTAMPFAKPVPGQGSPAQPSPSNQTKQAGGFWSDFYKGLTTTKGAYGKQGSGSSGGRDSMAEAAKELREAARELKAAAQAMGGAPQSGPRPYQKPVGATSVVPPAVPGTKPPGQSVPPIRSGSAGNFMGQVARALIFS